MPTTRGWTALGVSAALLALWAAFGERELMTTAVFLAAAVAVGLLFVRMTPPSLHMDRHMYPTAAHEGDLVTVEIRAATGRRLRNIRIDDVVHGLGVARFAAAATRAGHTLIARYEVSCRGRGVYTVGPADVTVSDPLALAERSASAGPVDRLTVYPRTERLRGFPAVRGYDPAVQTTKPTFTPAGGDDFFTLREYQTGDDLRKVHWPTSAKRDDLMIKQLEMPWQARAMVLFDVRAERYRDEETFEHAVRGAASVLSHLYRGGFSPDLWTAERAPGLRSGNRFKQAMDVLATVQPQQGLDLRAIVSRMRRQGVGGGALVIVTGTPDEEARATLRVLSRDFTRCVVMIAGTATDHDLTLFERSDSVTVASTPATGWTTAWRASMERTWSIA